MRLPALIVAASLCIGATSPGTLSVTVTGIRSAKGTVIACVWRDKAGFPTCQKSKTALRRTLPVSGASMTVRFAGLPAGSYAASVQHDEDGDGKLKTNFIGIPKEGVAISNDPGGIPKWGSAQVRVDGDTAITMRMRYL